MRKTIISSIFVVSLLLLAVAIYRFNFMKSLLPAVPIEQQVEHILRQNDCYVCHSYQSELPFYGNFPIIGTTVKGDVYRGRRYLNLDEVDFTTINQADLAKLEHSLHSGSMPLLKYKLLHWGKGYNKSEQGILANYITNIRNERFATGIASPQFASHPLQPMVAKLCADSSKVALGFELFHNTNLSLDGTVSCATCHVLHEGGVDGLRTSEGIGGQLGGINAPTVYNAAFMQRQFWNGRAADLAEQAAGPPVNPIEMGNQTWADIVARLKQDKALVAEFATIYPDGLTEANVTNAIAEFEKTLITPNAPIDRYLKGDKDAMTESQLAGMDLFLDYKCATCHVGQAIGGQSFETMGIAEDYFESRAKSYPEIKYNADDDGLYGFTGKETDKHKYKVPTLRNIALTAPYLHDGTAQTLTEATESMLRFQDGTTLHESEIDLLVDFMQTLTGNHPLMETP